MSEPADHIAKARRLLASGRHSLAGDFVPEAARQGYLGVFHAAQAYVISKVGRRPKTHGGVRSEFSRLAHEHGEIAADLVAFLGRSYEYKTYADYGASEAAAPAPTRDEARRALEIGARFVEEIAALLGLDPDAP